MTSRSFSAARRRLIAAGAAASLLPGVSVSQQAASNARGRYAVGRALLGVTPGTVRPTVPASVDISDRGENTIQCPQGPYTAKRPAEIAAQLWYPARIETGDVGVPVEQNLAGGPFPLILYAHAKRRWLTCPEHIPEPLPAWYTDYGQDFQRADRLLSQLASHGFVVAAPDLGWLVETFETGDWDGVGGLPRARIMLALHEHLAAKAKLWRIDMSRIGLVGHSTGGGACLALLDRLKNVRFTGLIAPGGDEKWLANAARSPATLVILATLELQLVHDPVKYIYEVAPRPRVLVRIEGANHLGFTDLCSADNRVCMDGDPPGLIDRMRQQDIAARYVSAMARAYLYKDGGAAELLATRNDPAVRVIAET
jgi:dienelactone hydrolase